MRRPIVSIRLLLLSLGLGLGCSGGDDDGPVGPGGDSLENVTLSRNSSVSFGKIYLEGMPSPKGGPAYAARVLVGGEPVGNTLVDSDESGFFIYAPLYPPAPNENGSVEIQLYSGEEEGPPLPLDVEALPAAPGSFEAVVNTLREHVAQRAEAMGTTFEDLAATSFDAVDPRLFRLKLAQSYVDANHPNDLDSFIANENGFLSAQERELLDRIFGYAPLAEVIQLDIDHHAATKLSPWSPRATSERAMGDKRGCVDAAPNLSTAGELSQAMLRSALSEIAIAPDSTPGRTLSALGTVLTGGSFIPAFGVGFGAAGTALAAWKASREYYSGVYPNQLTGMTFAYGPTLFHEDATEAGHWSDVRVSAASDGFVADRAITNVITSALGAYVSGAVTTGFQNLDFLDDVVMAGLNQSLDSYLEELGTDIIEFCGGSWTVDITGVPFSTGGVLNHRFAVDVEARSVIPLEVGADVLRIAAQPNMFGGRTVSADVALETKAIHVRVDPVDHYVDEPGEIINISATITSANRTWLTWEADHGSFEDGLGAQTNDSATRPLKTPVEVGHYPFSVTVTSASDLGLRSEAGATPRTATARVRLREENISIEPGFDCIAPGETRQFTAQVFGLDDYTLSWSLVEGEGSVSQSGLYQAPPASATRDRISVEVVGASDVIAFAEIAVGECNCSYEAVVTGALSYSWANNQAAYVVNVDEGGLYSYAFFFDNGTPGLSASVNGTVERQGPTPGSTGTWDCRVEFLDDVPRLWKDYETAPDVRSMFLDVFELTEDHMVGRFRGSVRRWDDASEAYLIADILFEFQAGAWDGGGSSWPCQ